MKTKLFFFVLLISMIQSIYGRNNWVFKTGFNISHLKNIENKPLLSASIGFERKFHIISYFSISPEILLSNQSVNIVKTANVSEIEYYKNSLISTNNIDLSIIFDFLISQKYGISVSLRAFPSYHVFLYEYTDYYNSGSGKINITSKIKGLSLNMGVFASYNVFSFEIRYMNNREIIDKKDQSYQYFQNNYMIHSLHFLFGYHF